MKILAFRIKNFRSIVDSGWCPFSEDGVTVLVGQNESGKTSVLDALSRTFSPLHVEDDDLRIDADFPSIVVCLSVQFSEITEKLSGYHEEQINAFEKFLNKNDGKLDMSFKWSVEKTDKERKFVCYFDIESDALPSLLSDALPKTTLELNAGPSSAPAPLPVTVITTVLDLTTPPDTATAQIALAQGTITTPQATPPAASLPTGQVPNSQPPTTTPADPVLAAESVDKSVQLNSLETKNIAAAIFAAAPLFTLFNQASGLLPDRVDIVTESGIRKLAGNGARAAENFLDVAGLNLERLVEGDERVRANLLKRANAFVSSDFANFWSQTIGKNEKLQLGCELDHYGPGEKSGKAYLSFWISDGPNQLYLKQRSQGVRWFVSFYLQLKASQKRKNSTVFLLDEPGANLHSKAQADVLKLINQISREIPVVYSTHSPHMIEYDKLFRVLAVQRDGEEGDSPTRLMHAHKLGAASHDTLSPVLTAMGVDLSSQQVVKQRDNVILEEISGFYYLNAFWKLCAEKQVVHFIAANGASNVDTLASMFLGWGLSFVIAVDDDTAGRSVFNKLKRNMFGDDDELARSRIFKIPNCKGIEDIFSKDDFAKFVLQDNFSESVGNNSEYVKSTGKSKPVLAYQFWNRVLSEQIKIGDLSDTTRAQIMELVKKLSSMLSAV